MERVNFCDVRAFSSLALRIAFLSGRAGPALHACVPAEAEMCAIVISLRAKRSEEDQAPIKLPIKH